MIIVSPQSQLDFGFFTSLGLGLGLDLGGQGLGLGLDNSLLSALNARKIFVILEKREIMLFHFMIFYILGIRN